MNMNPSALRRSSLFCWVRPSLPVGCHDSAWSETGMLIPLFGPVAARFEGRLGDFFLPTRL